MYQSVGEKYHVVKMGREYQGCGEECNVEKKDKGKQFHLPDNIEAVGRNRNRTENLGK